MDFSRLVLIAVLALNLVSCKKKMYSVESMKSVKIKSTAKPNFTIIIPAGYRPAIAVDCTFANLVYNRNIKMRYINKITAIDETGKVLLDTFVRPPVNVKHMKHGKNALKFLEVKELVIKLIKFRLLVGKSLDMFLKLLEVRHIKYLLRDTNFMYYGYSSIFEQYTFKDVARKFLKIEVKDSSTKENAMILMKIYKQYRQNWKEYLARRARLPMSVDCEMVECMRENKQKCSEVARVSIVDHNERVVYDRVFKPELPVTNCRTWITGLRYRDIKAGYSLRREKRYLVSLLKERVLVGHDVGQDLRALKISIPQPLIRDSCQFLKFRRMYPHKLTPSLQELAQNLLNMTIQKTHHNSVEDARANMRLYLMFKKEWDREAINHI